MDERGIWLRLGQVEPGSCRQTAQLDNSSPYIRADWRYAIRIERTEDLKRVVQGRMRMRSTLLQLQT